MGTSRLTICLFSKSPLQYLGNSESILYFHLCLVLCKKNQGKTGQKEEIKCSEENSYSLCIYSLKDSLKCISNAKASLQMCDCLDSELSLNAEAAFSQICNCV